MCTPWVASFLFWFWLSSSEVRTMKTWTISSTGKCLLCCTLAFCWAGTLFHIPLRMTLLTQTLEMIRWNIFQVMLLPFDWLRTCFLHMDEEITVKKMMIHMIVWVLNYVLLWTLDCSLSILSTYGSFSQGRGKWAKSVWIFFWSFTVTKRFDFLKFSQLFWRDYVR